MFAKVRVIFQEQKSLISWVPKLIAELALQSEPVMKAKSNIVDINVVADLSRQYKTMQAELTGKVERLEKEISKLKEELGMKTSIIIKPVVE